MKKLLTLLMITISTCALASGASTANSNLLLWLAIITTVAIFARASDKLGQPFVLGQLLVGIIIGAFAHYNIMGLSNMIHSEALAFFAELGSIFLLLEIGLESSLNDIASAGKHAIVVAIMGVVVPFVIGYFIVTPYILHSTKTELCLFIGSMLAVTSTGISISVFKDLKILKTEACQIVLAASVIDDILGLILLSITTSLMLEGSINAVNIGNTLLYVVIFFVSSIVFGKYLLPIVIKLLSQVNKNSDSVILIIIAFCFSMSYIAGQIGLAFIIGAFLSGILLYPQLFKGFKNIHGKADFTQNEHQLEYLIAPYGKIFTPLFFIYAGMQVDIISTFDYNTILTALAISFFAILGKIVAGIFLPKHINKWIVGLGMTPRGEIGLIFSIAGLQLKIIDSSQFAALLLMIIVTSVITPIGLTYITKRNAIA
jgi:Kef-type K+ transport system membrane component KefB